MAEYKDEIENLKAKLAIMELKELQPIHHQPQIVYLKSERKMPKLSGRPLKDSDPDVEEWIADMREHIGSIPSKEGQVDFIMNHLTGSAKSEVRLHSQEERKSGEQILHILEETFQPQETITQLERQFYQRNQLPNETLGEYSLALMKLLDIISKRQGVKMQSQDRVLKERFVDGLSDSQLKRELKKFAVDNRDLPFHEFRKQMLLWVEDKPPEPQAKVEVNKTSTSFTTNDEIFRMMQKQQELLEKQQKQIDYLTRITSNRGQYSGSQYRSYSSRPISRIPRGRGRENRALDLGNVVCFNCGGQGHKADKCPSVTRKETRTVVPNVIPPP